MRTALPNASFIAFTGTPVDITDIMSQVEDLLDDSFSAKGYVIRDNRKSSSAACGLKY